MYSIINLLCSPGKSLPFLCLDSLFPLIFSIWNINFYRLDWQAIFWHANMSPRTPSAGSNSSHLHDLKPSSSKNSLWRYGFGFCLLIFWNDLVLAPCMYTRPPLDVFIYLCCVFLKENIGPLNYTEIHIRHFWQRLYGIDNIHVKWKHEE